MAQNPQCSTLLLCDAVHQDRGSNKHYVLGTFNDIVVKKMPVAINAMIFMALTEIVGEVQVNVRIVHADDLMDNGKDVMKGDFKLKSRSPNDTIEVAVNFAVTFTKCGVYHIELVGNDGSVIHSRRFTIQQQK